jgi:hypothetical protein
MQRAKAWSTRGVTYSFKEETTSSSSKKGGVSNVTNGSGGGGEVETVVKKSQVVKTSTTGHQEKKPSGSSGDKVDSSLNNVVVDIGNQMIPDCIDLLSSNKKDKVKKSVRLAEGNEERNEGNQSSNQKVTSGSTSEFYSYSSSSSSSKKQVVSSSSTSSTTAGDSMVDYSRINSKHMSAAAGAMTQKQLDSPVCNFPVFFVFFVSTVPSSASWHFYFARITKTFQSTILGLFPNLQGYCAMSRRIHSPCVI